MRIVLASASPRRRMLLEQAGFAVLVRPVAVEERPHPGESPADTARRLARAKAMACTEKTLPVVAADTVVALGDALLGKPRDVSEAEAMLARLSGRTHAVITAVAVRRGARLREGIARARVRFRRLSAEEIRAYVRVGAVLDKAGAYGAQEGAAGFIVGISGPLDAVIGLPVRLVRDLLAA